MSGENDVATSDLKATAEGDDDALNEDGLPMDPAEEGLVSSVDGPIPRKRSSLTRKTRRPSKLVAAEQIQAVHGFFSAFIKSASRSAKADSWAKQLLQITDISEHSPPTTGLGLAKRERQRDIISTDIMNPITIFFKQRRDPAWLFTTSNMWVHARRVFEMRSKVWCIGDELERWISVNWIPADSRKRLQKSHSGATNEPLESTQEKQARLRNFWAQYHQPNRAFEGKARFADSCSTPNLHMSAGLSSSPKAGEEHRKLGMTDMTWKIRSAKGKAAAGVNLAFEASGGLQLGRSQTLAASVEARPGSRGSFKTSLPLVAETFQPRHAGRQSALPALQRCNSNASQGRPASRESGGRGGSGSDSGSRCNSRGDSRGGSQKVVTPAKRRVWWWKTGVEETGGPVCLGASPAKAGLSASQSLPELRGHGRRGGAAVRGAARGSKNSSVPARDRQLERPGSRNGCKALPPIEDTFVPPHGKAVRNAGGVAESEAPASPTAQYLQACDRDGLVPMPVPLLTGHSPKLNAQEQAMGDHDLYAMAATSCLSRIEDAELGGSMVLSDAAIAAFIVALANATPSNCLRQLSLNKSPHAGALSQDAILRLLTEDAAPNLRQLNLCGIPLLVRQQLPLCKAISQHASLEVLSLAETGLGSNPTTRQCLTELARSDSLKSLDLGWNCFAPEVLSEFGAAVVERGMLESIVLASCAASTSMSTNISPIVYFAEHLRGYDTLTSLDVSLNRIDFRGALVLEDVLDNCKGLTTLDVSNNPLRVLGMRSLLRLLARGTTVLVHFRCDGCYASDVPEPVESCTFNASNPAGRYVLNLSQHYDRSFLRMLCKTCTRFGVGLESSMLDISFAPPPYQVPQRDARGLWQVPHVGKLSVTFSMEEIMAKTFQKVGQFDFPEILELYRTNAYLQPCFYKTIPLLAQWKSLDSRVLEQRIMLQALAKDFTFTYPQLYHLCQSRGMEADVISFLMPRLLGGTLPRYLAFQTHMHSMSDYVTLLKRASLFLRFNPDNPTGHYRLDLANPLSHAVAESLMVLDQWEANIGRREKRPDTSQSGNWSCARNTQFQHRKLDTSLAEWLLPERDILEFDYSSSRRPPSKAVMLDDDTFTQVLLVLQLAMVDPQLVIETMRSISHLVYVSAMHLRQLLGIFRGEDERGDALVCWFNRTVDMHNEKVFRVRFEKPEELAKLRCRLGFAVFFPFIQPEQSVFELDFAHYDERMAASILMSLAMKESMGNLRKYSYQLPDKTMDPLTLGVPRSWEVFDKMPKGGVFRVTYMCAPEDRNFKLRKDLQEKYGRTEVTALENEVMWWAALQEAPNDVLELLYFIRAKYNSFDEAFAVIDGPGGNGDISWKELEEGYHNMKCTKFKGPKERERIQAVFRYLDPSGDGSVSKDEFAVIDQFWNELQLSMKELMQFCMRTFGDLESTWDELDEDGGGEVTVEEWTDALCKVGYFGPAHAIFDFLDDDDGGAISFEELEKMTQFA
eukprot:TRINITY_DN27399_c0_g2_i1.p1 TRINITY_DN27399_c0_g2~~TRINITY_DN27399_c0_g2_i1.p1  ORF type:complete len:1484 (+),score=240.35 TRINITY_DN27399_c0_g2_i1:247-4698(+)